MKKRTLSFPLVLGIGLIFCAVLLLAVLQIRMHRSVQTSQAVAAQLLALLPARTQGAAESYPDPTMPVLEIGGTDYAGLLEIPARNVTLPIADSWDSGMLSARVGRFWGSAYDRTLVIGGPDFPGQFDFCDAIDPGTVVSVTDLTGRQFTYVVSRVDRAEHAESSWLMHADYALTLFCRDASSFEYIAVRCVPSGS